MADEPKDDGPKSAISEAGFEKLDMDEIGRGQGPSLIIPHYPKPLKKYRLVYQAFNQSIEEIYFWMLGHMRDDWGLYEVKKITDIFSASTQSSFWGQAQQRLSIQQQNISNYLQSIGKLVKELFQLVRDLRILDERLDLYNESFRQLKGTPKDRKKTQSAEIVLRGYWTDLVEGGAKSPSSVYGLASQVGFAILPDLFFSAPVMRKGEVDSYVDSLEFNRKVREVLKRKLKAFTVWKDHTYIELKNRRKFSIKYLGQHFNVIQMYISWVKPYLNNVKRLSMDEKQMDSADLIGAFEGASVEIEVMCSKPAGSGYNSVIVAHWHYVTRPTMDFKTQDYQSKGPIHVGRTEITLRSYAWTDDQMKKYVRARQSENLELIGRIDESLKSAIDALGGDLQKYIDELEGTIREKDDDDAKADKPTQAGVLEPFTSVFSGFAELGTALFPFLKPSGVKKTPAAVAAKKKKSEGKAGGFANTVMWNTYKNFKKSHRMVTW